MSQPASPTTGLGRAFVPWALAAGLALVAAWLGRLCISGNLEAERWRTQHALAELALKSAGQQLEAERLIARGQLAQLDLAHLKIAALASRLSTLPDARGVAIYHPARREGVLALEQLPPPPPDQRYELWLLEDKPDAAPVSAGGFEVAAGGITRLTFKPSAEVGAIKAFAVSREKNDGARTHAKPAEVILFGSSR